MRIIKELLILENEDVVRREAIDRPRHYLEGGGHVDFSWYNADVYDDKGKGHYIKFPVWLECDPANWTIIGHFALACVVGKGKHKTTTIARVNLETKTFDHEWYGGDLAKNSGWGGNVLYQMDGDELVIVKENAEEAIRHQIPNVPKDPDTVKFIFDGNESMIVAIRKSKVQMDIYSFKTAKPGEWKHVVSITDGISKKFKLVMATPTLLCIADITNEMSISCNLLTGEKKNMGGDADLVFTPDGRYVLKFQDGATWDEIGGISPDGSRFYQEKDEDEYIEMTLKEPFAYPIYTQFYTNGRWFRVMSNNKLETSESWGTGKDPDARGNIAFAAWISRPEGVKSMKEAKEIYLMELAKAMAREIVNIKT